MLFFFFFVKSTVLCCYFINRRRFYFGLVFTKTKNPDSASDEDDNDGDDLSPGFRADTAPVRLYKALSQQTRMHHSELTETLVMRLLTRFEPQPTYLRLRNRRRFHCRVSPPVFSYAAGSWFDPSLSWWKVLLRFSSSAAEIPELLRTELKRALRTAPLFQGCRIMKVQPARCQTQHSSVWFDSHTLITLQEECSRRHPFTPPCLPTPVSTSVHDSITPFLLFCIYTT